MGVVLGLVLALTGLFYGEPDVRTEAGALSLETQAWVGAARVSGAVARRGTRLVVTTRLPDGHAVKITVATGDLPLAAREIAARVARAQNVQPPAVTSVSLSALVPWAEALDLLQEGNTTAAARALASADPALLATRPNLRAIVDAVLKSRDLGPEDRALVTLVADPKTSEAFFAGAKLIDLVKEDHLPALRRVAGMPDGALGADEAAVLQAAQRIAELHPSLASDLALRALRSKQDVRQALPLVRAQDLGPKELAALESWVEQAAGGRMAVGLRLRAEIRARRGDLAGAARDANDAVQLDPKDRRGLRLYGRILLEQGDQAKAVKAFEVAAMAGDVLAQREQARALILGGDAARGSQILERLASDPRSAESKVAVARSLSERGMSSLAVTKLEEAHALSPADPSLLRELAAAYESTKAEKRAAEIIAEATSIEKGEQIAIGEQMPAPGEPRRGSGPGSRPDPLAAAPAEPPRIVFDEKASALALALPSLLDRFPMIASARGKRILVVERAGAEASPWSPYDVHSRLVGEGLAQALASPGYGLRPVIGERVPEASNERLARLALASKADLVAAYQVAAAGGDARISLTVYDAVKGAVFESRTELPGRPLGVMSLKASWVVSGILLTLLVVLWLGLEVGLGSGELVVRLKQDPGATDQLYAIAVRRGATPPDIRDVPAWIRGQRKRGPRQSRYAATHAGAMTRFPKVRSGTWTVHLYGTHTVGPETRVIAPLKQTVKVDRNGSATVNFDLVPGTSECMVTVHDGEQPVAGAAVMVDEKGRRERLTGPDGTTMVQVPKGRHILWIVAKEMEIRRPLEVLDTKPRTVSINLERERKLAALDLGISVEVAPAPAPRGTAPPAAEKSNVEDPFAPVEEFAAEMPSAPNPNEFEPLPSYARPSRRPLPASSDSLPTVDMPVDLAETIAPLLAAKDSPVARVGAEGSGKVATNGGLARYTRVAELGRGTMGAVFRAHDNVLDRDVALKLVAEEVQRFPVAVQMFQQEAKALAALNHPNIVMVFDQGRDGDQYFMVMELISGRTLEKLLEEQERLALSQALQIVDQLCAGLSYAHSRRVIHRDVKPANIFVSDEGQVKLGDFGLARVMKEVQIRQTEIRGTPLYMAPEAIRGADIDFRADLYSVGCTMFELLTGRPPFIDGEILYHHLHTAPPRPSAFVPRLPGELEEIVMACLVKDKAARIDSADTIRLKLRPFLARLA